MKNQFKFWIFSSIVLFVILTIGFSIYESYFKLNPILILILFLSAYLINVVWGIRLVYLQKQLAKRWLLYVLILFLGIIGDLIVYQRLFMKRGFNISR